jgi:vitamin B12 transporter
MRLCLYILLLSFIALQAKAQVHDTLAPAEVRSLRISGGDIKDKFAPGVKVQGIDSLTRLPYLGDNLSVLLAGATTAAVKSYGFNSFATVSFRGASTAQSAVYWEGIPLMNGATGITDVSLLPVSLIDSISLNYGSNAALLGSGNVGGALMLHDPRPEFVTHPDISGSVNLSAGSFAQFSGSAIFRHSSKRFFVSGGISALTAKNNYEVIDMQGESLLMDHAEQSQLSYNLTTAWKIDARNVLSAHIWQQQYDREIPRALFEAYSRKKQRDEDTRFLLNWERTSAASRTYARAAYVKSSYDYSDSAIVLHSSLQSNHIYAEAGCGGRISDGGQLLVFAPVQYFFLDGTTTSPTQTRIAIATAYTQSLVKDKLNIGANLRAESFDGDLILLPGINASYQLRTPIRLRLNAQRTYRAPTLNELYYQPGGNKDLKPEQGWSFDGGYDWNPSKSRTLSFTHSLSAYNRNIKDWIIWLGGAIWTPHNLASVHSRGLETENALSGTFRNVTWRLGLNAAYTRSTTTESYLTGDNSIGCQIPYVPFLTGAGIAGLGWGRFYFEWSSTFTGRRYITTDESAYLTSYTLGNLRIRYSATAKRIPFILQGSVNNVFNAQYAVVGFRPMPGINYRVSASFSLSSE